MHTPTPSRRQFLRTAAAAGISGAALGPWSSLQALAQTAQGSDYKALVCLFMFGGNDGNNLLVPYEASAYQKYANIRGRLALARDSLNPLTVNYRDKTTGQDKLATQTYALHGEFSDLSALVNAGKAAVIANIGPLMVPTTLQQWNDRSVPLPANLFSHADQQNEWMTDSLDAPGRSGWGGRIVERVIPDDGGTRGYACISVSGNTLWATGNHPLAPAPYRISPNGKFGFDFYQPGGGDRLSQAVGRMLTQWSTQEELARPFEATWLRAVRRSLDAQSALASTLQASAVPASFRQNTLNTDIGQQLALIARLISARTGLQQTRQCFFCSVGGFDTHGSDQLDEQASNFRDINAAVADFMAALTAMGLADKVTLFTASDFGRTFVPNGQGTDHGWGNHHFVVGGGVNGPRLAGEFPDHTIGGASDVGSGNWLPTTSIDQLGRELARWFGASASVAEIFPRASYFPDTLSLMKPA